VTVERGHDFSAARTGIGLQERVRRHQYPGKTVTALASVVGEESRPERWTMIESLKGGDFGIVDVAHRKRATGPGYAVDLHLARPALFAAAAVPGA
jgi:hypothetical protein